MDFLREVMGFAPWTAEDSSNSGRSGKTGQDEWIQALADNGRVSIVACNGSGKTTVMAGAVHWFMATRKNATVVTVAPRWDQVTELLWAKMRGMYLESRVDLTQFYPGPLTSKWEIAPGWSARGFSTDREDRAQGFHSYTSTDGEAGELLAIVDEAAGVAPFVFNALRGWMTKGRCYIAYIGNPNVSEGEFFDSQLDPDWARFQVSAFDCPSWVVTDEWIDEMRKRPGEGTPQWQIRVEGQFSDAGGEYQFFPMWLLRSVEDVIPGWHEDLHMGVDLADSGGDICVATLTRGDVVQKQESWTTDELMDSVANIIALAESWGISRRDASHIHIDCIGIGAGVCSRLREKGWAIDPVDYGSKKLGGEWRDTIGDVKCLNRKAELHQAARQLMIEKRIGIPARFAVLRKQLQWLRWAYAEGTEAMKVESKKKLRARAGVDGSPDYADSFLLTLSRVRQGSRVEIL